MHYDDETAIFASSYAFFVKYVTHPWIRNSCMLTQITISPIIMNKGVGSAGVKRMGGVKWVMLFAKT